MTTITPHFYISYRKFISCNGQQLAAPVISALIKEQMHLLTQQMQWLRFHFGTFRQSFFGGHPKRKLGPFSSRNAPTQINFRGKSVVVFFCSKNTIFDFFVNFFPIFPPTTRRSLWLTFPVFFRVEKIKIKKRLFFTDANI